MANIDAQEMRALTVIDQPLNEADVWNQMIQSFLSPMEGEPARPNMLVVCRRDFHQVWEPLLEEIGVHCQYEMDPQPVSQLLEAMGRKLDEMPCRPPKISTSAIFPNPTHSGRRTSSAHPPGS